MQGSLPRILLAIGISLAAIIPARPAASQTYCIVGDLYGAPIIVPVTPGMETACLSPITINDGSGGGIGGPGVNPGSNGPDRAGGETTSPPGKRIAMSNGLAFPYTYVTADDAVRHYQKQRTVPSSGPKATYSNIELTYANFLVVNGGEVADTQPITIQAEILYNGAYFPVSFNGQPTATIRGGEAVTGSVSGLTLESGAIFFERVRVVGSAIGTQRYLISNGARRIMWEGVLGEANPDVNLLGGKDGHGAMCSFAIESGRIASAEIRTPGVNYTSAGIVGALDPATGTEAAVGYTTYSSGKMTSVVITDGGANFSPETRCIIMGGGGFGQNAAVFAASMITGVPNVGGLKSILIVGDSIARGYGSTDSKGDLSGNYGIFERAVANRFATVSTAISGNTATAYSDPASHARMYGIVLRYVTHALIDLGTNDIAGNGYSAATVARANQLTATELRNAGIQTSLATLIPRVSGVSATREGQNPMTGFAQGGAADLYNSWVRAGTTGLASDWGVLDARAAYQDAVAEDRWRVDSIMTNDGIHPSLAIGIPFGAAQLTDSFNALQ